jgi:N-acetylglucosaminyldiphosphoundecaprenol N-acetyl-beta-D-mannosaminyltransferase
MGAPVQALSVARNADRLGAKVCIGVGGLFDFYSGRIHGAPRWMRDSGLEWVYRLMQEPGRMWKRCLLGNGVFLGRVLGEKFGPAGGY